MFCQYNHNITISTLGGCSFLEGLVFNNFHLRGCCSVESIAFQHLPLCKDMVVLKSLTWVMFTLVVCGGLERTHLHQFPPWEDVVI